MEEKRVLEQLLELHFFILPYQFSEAYAMVTYQRLWETLKQKNIRKHDLMELADISSTTLTKLNKDEVVALTVLVKICKALDCQIEDVVEISDEAI